MSQLNQWQKAMSEINREFQRGRADAYEALKAFPDGVGQQQADVPDWQPSTSYLAEQQQQLPQPQPEQKREMAP